MRTDRFVVTAAVLGSLLFLNVLSCNVFGRLDLTEGGQYTLSETSLDTLRGLTDPVNVKAYFSSDLPPQFALVSRDVRDMLDEYYAHSGGYFSYEFVDPLQEETDEDKEKKKDVKQDIFGRQVREKTSVETELERLGIPPVQVQVRQEGKLEVKQAYLGLALKYGDKTEAIPVIQQTDTLEYDITSLLKKLTRTKTPKIAFVKAGGEFDPQKEMGRAYSLVTQLYEAVTLDLATTPEIADDIDALVVIGRSTFSDQHKQAIDAFIMSGRSVAFLLDNVSVDLATLQAEPVDHGLKDLVAAYGVKVEDGLVLDAECATMQVQQQRGFMRIAQPVKFPYIPISKGLDQNNVLTRGMNELGLPFIAPLELQEPAQGAVKAEILAKSSDQSWVAVWPYNLDPFQRWTRDAITEQKARPILVALSGKLPSAFGAPPEVASDASGSAEARVLVAGGSAFATDQFMSPPNQALVLNMIDWLVLDQGLLTMRTRGLGPAPLGEIGEGSQLAVRLGNIAGLPLVFVAFGLIRWRRREDRRRKVTL